MTTTEPTGLPSLAADYEIARAFEAVGDLLTAVTADARLTQDSVEAAARTVEAFDRVLGAAGASRDVTDACADVTHQVVRLMSTGADLRPAAPDPSEATFGPTRWVGAQRRRRAAASRRQQSLAPSLTLLPDRTPER